MFNSHLHSIIATALSNLIIFNDKNNEDDFRALLTVELNKHLPYVDIIIPSTRSGDGDIKILRKKIEIKFANFNRKNCLQMSEIIEDFDSLVKDKIDFFIIGFQTGSLNEDETCSIHRYINFHDLKNTYKGKGSKYRDKNVNYKGYSIFIGGCYVSESVNKLGPGKKKTNSYLYFEKLSFIRREYFLEVESEIYIHAKIIGSCEDGAIYFIFSKANNIKSYHRKEFGDIKMLHNGDTYFFATEYRFLYRYKEGQNSLNKMRCNCCSNLTYLYKIYN